MFGRSNLPLLPGQFHFIKLYREGGLPVEEHPFTISSSPTEKGFVSSTIKESGDFTATIGQTKPGDTASVQGPYGRFCNGDLENKAFYICGPPAMLDSILQALGALGVSKERVHYERFAL
ncbi:TPA: hypothetical protein EYP66_04440 [Candidatus Poribacteria bacterium]|nr:hypothetical protein [Candidatus Poribacteria bacterium]